MLQEPLSPETYTLPPTKHCPNSPLPVLVYRGVLPTPLTKETAREALEKNSWLQGGVFEHYPAHHFHSISHECYAIFKGSTRFLYGTGPLDEENGLELDVQAGDIVVHAAGVAHCNSRSSNDFGYIGVYPRGSPHWDNNFCKADASETAEKAANARSVPIPDHDPVYGLNGPLVGLWRAAAGVTA